MVGKKIVDSYHTVTINIRQRDIDGATPRDGRDCVAGRCVLRTLDAEVVYFYRSKAYVQWDDEQVMVRYHLSRDLQKKVIEVLDDPHRPNSEIQPGLYELQPVPPRQRLGLDRTPKNPGTRAKRVDRGHRVMGRVTAAYRG
jgi:hypothetical protein